MPQTRPIPISRESRLRKHLRLYRHFAAIAASASRSMADAERCRLPGWGAHWVHHAEVQRDAGARMRDCRKRYVRLLAHAE